MRVYKAGTDRAQGMLFPPRVDEYVGANNPVRAIDAYVESLDLARLGFTKTQPNEHASGQPAYPPAALLKLYLYGYINRVRSSRRLERECHRNLEVIWLLENRRPSYKTIADFRKENGDALRKTHMEFIGLCNELSLFGGETVGVDGSLFRGNVSRKSFSTTKKLTKQIEQLQERIEQWLWELDAADTQEGELGDDEQLAEKLERLKTLREEKRRKEAQRRELEQAGRTQCSRVDPDARLLRKQGQKVTGYNVQIVIDERYKLIVADEVVTDPNDLQQLHPMAQAAKAAMNVEELNIIADAGYYSGQQIAACLEDGITPYVPAAGKKNKPGGRYNHNDFVYDRQNDVYLCPANQTLRPKGSPRLQSGSLSQRYLSSKSSCRKCEHRPRCLSPKSSCREVWRHEHEDLLKEHHKRMAAHPDIMRKRSGLVEHPFGTIKRRAGWDHFLVRGLQKVRGEWSLMALCYNFTRLLNLFGMDWFRDHMAQRLAVPTRECRFLWHFGVRLNAYLFSVFHRLSCLTKIRVANIKTCYST